MKIGKWYRFTYRGLKYVAYLEAIVNIPVEGDEQHREAVFRGAYGTRCSLELQDITEIQQCFDCIYAGG